jgi:hypothetical protein
MVSNELAEKLEQLLEPHNAGEQELKDWLRGYGYKVKDVSDNPNYWKQDIDLIVNDKITIEVKWDSLLSSTGNLFIELVSDIDKNKDGWFRFCKADYLAYGAAEDKIFLIFKFDELKAHIEAHKDEYKTTTAADYNKYGIAKYSKGYLVPVDSLCGMFKEIDVG